MATARLDTLYTAETPEGITLSLRPAGIVARGLAYLIDLAIRGCLFIAVAITVGLMGKAGAAVLLLAYFALEWFYPVVFELTRSAATPGKRALGLRVVMDSGLPVTPAASLTRNLLRAADFMPALFGAGLVSMLWRGDSKRLGDLAAGTLVVFTDAVKLHGEVPLATAAGARAAAVRRRAGLGAGLGRPGHAADARAPRRTRRPGRAGAGHGRSGSSATQRLLGVAQWLMGRREGEARR